MDPPREGCTLERMITMRNGLHRIFVYAEQENEMCTSAEYMRTTITKQGYSAKYLNKITHYASSVTSHTLSNVFVHESKRKCVMC